MWIASPEPLFQRRRLTRQGKCHGLGRDPGGKSRRGPARFASGSLSRRTNNVRPATDVCGRPPERNREFEKHRKPAVGRCRMSGLIMRLLRPRARMVFADRIQIALAGSKPCVRAWFFRPRLSDSCPCAVLRSRRAVRGAPPVTPRGARAAAPNSPSSPLLRFPSRRPSRRRVSPVSVAPHRERPDDPGHLVRQGHRDNFERLLPGHPPEPGVLNLPAPPVP